MSRLADLERRMRYGSVCSGIESASVAWASPGWQPAWFSETEAFPSTVLAAHWPEVANLGDMTGIAAAVRAGHVEAPDVLVGGTPCQRGARIVIGNSTAPRVIDLYSRHGFELHHISARRSISGKGSTRETAKDLVAILQEVTVNRQDKGMTV